MTMTAKVNVNCEPCPGLCGPTRAEQLVPIVAGVTADSTQVKADTTNVDATGKVISFS